MTAKPRLLGGDRLDQTGPRTHDDGDDCPRCTLANHVSDRFCADCGLPLGALQPDAGAACDALEPYELPEAADPDVARLIGEFVRRTRHDASTCGRAGSSSSRSGSTAGRRFTSVPLVPDAPRAVPS